MLWTKRGTSSSVCCYVVSRNSLLNRVRAVLVVRKLGWRTCKSGGECRVHCVQGLKYDHSVLKRFGGTTSPRPGRLHRVNSTCCKLLTGWAGTVDWNEALHRMKLQVPAIIVAYHAFMNSVKGFDQLHWRNRAMRREQRISMSLFTFALYTTVQKTYAASLRVAQSTISLTDFKERSPNSLSCPKFCAVHFHPRSQHKFMKTRVTCSWRQGKRKVCSALCANFFLTTLRSTSPYMPASSAETGFTSRVLQRSMAFQAHKVKNRSCTIRRTCKTHEMIRGRFIRHPVCTISWVCNTKKN